MGFSARKLSAFYSKVIRLGNSIQTTNANGFSSNSLGNAIAVSEYIEIPNESQPEPAIKVYSLNGTNWSQVGNNILRPQDPNSRLNIETWGDNIKINSNGNVIAFNYYERIQESPRLVQNKTRVLTWNGSNWIQLGSDIVSPISEVSSSIQMVANSSCDRLFICVRYSGIYKNSVFSWNGSSWNQIGADIGPSNALWLVPSMNSAGDRIALFSRPQGSYGEIRVFSFNGSSWVQTGATITGTAAPYLSYGGSIALNSSGDILCAEYETGAGSDQKYLRFFSFNGSSWVQVKQNLNIKTGEPQISLLSNGDTIAYYENSIFHSSEVYVSTWNGSSWVEFFIQPGTGSYTGGAAIPNSLENYVAYTSGNNIIVLKLLDK